MVNAEVSNYYWYPSRRFALELDMQAISTLILCRRHLTRFRPLI